MRLDQNEKKSGEKIYIDNPKIIITKKGIACLNFIYSDFDILYHCSLDSPVPKSLIRESFIHPHSNEIEIRNYALYCLKSTLSFIQYLKKIDKEERGYIDSLNIGINSRDYLLPINGNNKVQECLDKRLNYLIKSLNETSLKEFDEFLDKFKEMKTNIPANQNI